MDDDLVGVNAAAAMGVVESIREAGAVLPIDEALVSGFLMLAAAVDAKPGDAGLWREYRAFALAVREAATGGSDDDTKAFLDSVRTPVGNTAKR